MWRALGMVIVLLCSTVSMAAGKSRTDARLQVSQAAFEEATQLLDAGKYAGALERGEHALSLRRAVLGDTHPEVAACLRLLGELFVKQGKAARAEPLLHRALAIQEAALGKSHPHVAHTLNSLALFFRAQGSFSQAVSHHQRALAIQEAALGRQHPDVAETLNSLASVYEDQGLYGQAEPLIVRAISLQEAAFGKTHPKVATSLNNLAIVYRSQGLYAQAVPALHRALAIRAETLDPRHPDIASSSNDLGTVYYYQQMYARAELLYERALTIREAALGEHHPDVAHTLNNLGLLYTAQELYDQAERFHERALAIREAALGKHHPSVASSLDNLASLHLKQGAYAQAESLYGRALAIREATLGRNHPQVAHTITGLAQALLAQQRLDEAVTLLTRAFTVSEEYLRKETLDFSESRLTSFLELMRAREDLLYSLPRAHPEHQGVLRLTLAVALLRKGRSLEEATHTSRILAQSLTPENRATFARLQSLRTELTTLVLQGSGTLSPANYRQRIEELAAQGDALETELARSSAPLRSRTTLPPLAEMVDRVAAALPRNSALIEFIAYVDRPLAPKPSAPSPQAPNPVRYLALVLFPDGRVRALDLGPAAAIDRASSALCDAITSRDVAYLRPAQRLYSLAFQPLLPLLGGAHRLFLAPDGQLAFVNFDTLHNGRRFLIDVFEFTYLNSGRDLLPRPQGATPSRSVFVFAEPTVGAPLATLPFSLGDLIVLAQRGVSLGGNLLEQAWPTLPGTRQEAHAIQRLLPSARIFLGQDATKQRLLQLSAPGVLHIASHGFFLEDTTIPPDSRAVGFLDSLGADAPSRPLPNPLLRSGLVLSDAEAMASTGTDTAPRTGGGLVTALELAGMNLWGTELVVLSACDTGRGDVKLGQGTYGLRRALAIAGAETVVMSLWKVNDETTHLLMESYYRNLRAGQGRGAALRDAMRSLRETRPHPYYWGSFIAVGRDAPLSSVLSAGAW
jgi:CHAT domain-containing protein/Tfp pilus assembly protein PilF